MGVHTNVGIIPKIVNPLQIEKPMWYICDSAYAPFLFNLPNPGCFILVCRCSHPSRRAVFAGGVIRMIPRQFHKELPHRSQSRQVWGMSVSIPSIPSHHRNKKLSALFFGGGITSKKYSGDPTFYFCRAWLLFWIIRFLLFQGGEGFQLHKPRWQPWRWQWHTMSQTKGPPTQRSCTPPSVFASSPLSTWPGHGGKGPRKWWRWLRTWLYILKPSQHANI